MIYGPNHKLSNFSCFPGFSYCLSQSKIVSPTWKDPSRVDLLNILLTLSEFLILWSREFLLLSSNSINWLILFWMASWSELKSREADTLEGLSGKVRWHLGHRQVQKGSFRLNFSLWFYQPIMQTWSYYPKPFYYHQRFSWLWSLSFYYLTQLDHFLGDNCWMNGIGQCRT